MEWPTTEALQKSQKTCCTTVLDILYISRKRIRMKAYILYIEHCCRQKNHVQANEQSWVIIIRCGFFRMALRKLRLNSFCTGISRYSDFTAHVPQAKIL